MAEYNTVNGKLSNSQLNKIKSAVKSNEGTTLRMNAKMFSANNLLTTTQTTKLRNAIGNNISTDIKLCKAQISKVIQSGGFLGKLLGPLFKNCTAIIKINQKTPWSIRSYSSFFSNRCRSSKKDIWFWNNFSNFK